MRRLTDFGLAIGIGSLLLASCGEDSRVAGNSANTGNAQATGRVLDAKGSPVGGAWVECRPDSLLPWDPQEEGWTDLTDSLGRYLCRDLPFGRVGVAVVDPGTGLTRWRLDTLFPGEGSSTRESVDTLAPPGGIRVALPPGTFGTVYLTGLRLNVAVRGEEELEIPSVPAGWRGSVKIARSATRSMVVDSGIRVESGKVDSAGYTRRSARLRVDLDGRTSGAVVDFPVLVRLDSSWQGFSEALPDGSDLRLSTATGKPLPITVASWDPAGRTAAIWTLLDTLAAPGATVDLVLGWGNPVPAPSTEVFATSRGWLAAWPLGEAGDSAMDRLHRFPGVQSRTTVVPGPFGKASRFDGKSSQILVPGSETGSLDLPEGGPFTYSCWVQVTATGGTRAILGKGRYGPGLSFRTLADTNVWEGTEYRQSPTGIESNRTRATTGTWTHLAMTVSGSNLTLYVDGVPAPKDSSFNREDVGRKASMFVIGTSIDTTGATSTYAHFGGDLAEVWVQSKARSADWIRLAAANQKPGGKSATLLR